jgi:glycine cleavage system regulatory protein
MKSIVITMVGNDKPGLIDSIAKIINSADGSWQASSFAHMAGHFAGFAEILISEESEQTLLKSLSEHPDLKITLSEGIHTGKPELKTASVEIEGNDRCGIVRELSGVLHQFDLNIMQFDSACESAPNWGNQIFKAKANVELPEKLDIDELKEALEALSDDLMVDIKL